MAITHRHTCACGSELHCTTPADLCGVFEPWDCPTCVQQQRDEYFQQYAELRQRRAAAKAIIPTKERRHAHSR